MVNGGGSGSEWRQLKGQDVHQQTKKKSSGRTRANDKAGRASRTLGCKSQRRRIARGVSGGRGYAGVERRMVGRGAGVP